MTHSPDRRGAILEAALACFLERGYAATSIADIRGASGASTGSIYHFFEGKPALALALIDIAVAGWSATSAKAFDPRATPEQAIKASVSGFVSWALAQPALARFLDEMRTLSLADPAFAAIAERFRQGRSLGEAEYARYLAAGAVRPLPWPLAHALMLGPAYDFVRLQAGPAPDAAQILAEAAWNAVRA